MSFSSSSEWLPASMSVSTRLFGRRMFRKNAMISASLSHHPLYLSLLIVVYNYVLWLFFDAPPSLGIYLLFVKFGD